MNKICSKCKALKNVSCFSIRKSSLDGLQTICKDCKREINNSYAINNRTQISEYRSLYYKNNKEKIDEKHLLYYTKNRDKILDVRSFYTRRVKVRFNQSIKRADRRNILWELTFLEYQELIEQSCYYCQNNLDVPVEAGTGLDRKDNNLGYIKNNCVSCCNFCNTIKSNKLTCDEMQLVAKLLIEKRKL